MGGGGDAEGFYFLVGLESCTLPHEIDLFYFMFLQNFLALCASGYYNECIFHRYNSQV